jgi:hypothetical protein
VNERKRNALKIGMHTFKERPMKSSQKPTGVSSHDGDGTEKNVLSFAE